MGSSPKLLTFSMYMKCQNIMNRLSKQLYLSLLTHTQSAAAPKLYSVDHCKISAFLLTHPTFPNMYPLAVSKKLSKK